MQDTGRGHFSDNGISGIGDVHEARRLVHGNPVRTLELGVCAHCVY